MWIDKFNCRICLVHEKIIYKLFILWFSQDGWYFISDLSEIPGLSYLASKIRISWKKLREEETIVPNFENTYVVELSKPKISHHLNWRAHISWTNITSWYNTDWTSKWLSIESFHLSWTNDGWPIFVFSISLDILTNFPKIDIDDNVLKKTHLIINTEIISDIRKNIKENYWYAIEWYYIPKSKVSEDLQLPTKIIKVHPIYWKINLVLIPTPPNMPWLIALWCIKEPLLSKNNICSFSWAPWVIDDDGSRESLWLIINTKGRDKWSKKNFRTLDRLT